MDLTAKCAAVVSKHSQNHLEEGGPALVRLLHFVLLVTMLAQPKDQNPTQNKSVTDLCNYSEAGKSSYRLPEPQERNH